MDSVISVPDKRTKVCFIRLGNIDGKAIDCGLDAFGSIPDSFSFSSPLPPHTHTNIPFWLLCCDFCLVRFQVLTAVASYGEIDVSEGRTASIVSLVMEAVTTFETLV
jgi:hypothetical protein